MATAAALCFIDLDRFKIVNDTAGHGAGDVLLRELGYVIRHHVRPDDLLARLGGDEFALLLKDCSVDQAEHVCQKVIDAVRERRFRGKAGSTTWARASASPPSTPTPRRWAS